MGLVLNIGSCLLLIVSKFYVSCETPTLYEYYTGDGIHSGLVGKSDQFTLNGKPFVIFGGSLHYFRLVPQYWRSTLLQYKAAGLNSIQLYLPWNLHEEVPEKFDFESPFLNLKLFLQEIQAADMFAIVRPGPYICAEWEFGGLPAWLLKDPNMRLRTNYKPYIDRVKNYWNRSLSIINQFQFTNGGPVIAFQIENEYFGSFWIEHSAEYLQLLYNITRNQGFRELIFTSDPGFIAQQLPIADIFPQNSSTYDVLESANLNMNSLESLLALKKLQPNRPLYVSEFWPGWFDSWHENFHHKYSVQQFEQEISDILFKANGSINFYMFFGGTNFGFMNGYRVVTSYDYDAPLSESGNYTEKYYKTREFYQKLVQIGKLPKTRLPDVPKARSTYSYGTILPVKMLSFESMLKHVDVYSKLSKPVPMEMLNRTSLYGQNFGFILYRVESKHPVQKYEVTGTINDRATLMVQCGTYKKAKVVIEDGQESFNETLTYSNETNTNHCQFDLLVENMGRFNDGVNMELQRKGILFGDIKLDEQTISNITIYSMDFTKTFLQKIDSDSTWTKSSTNPKLGNYFPTIYRAEMHINHIPQDTFLELPKWRKGNVFVNGFNIGRYWWVGPQKTLYIPGPLLKKGTNVIDIFELEQPGTELHFLDHAILE
ncbi:hypothetical protein RDWZM_003251 [Blomia tropicalis]|uniref:Beta-galactosidase n=1 Tax=Blomia tropicalis TaxID=40697 RepID=A0A9Q0RSD3_BLOTA|nr:hypothetical protein RDWZM_003251 [Blomia tropicalis]